MCVIIFLLVCMPRVSGTKSQIGVAAISVVICNRPDTIDERKEILILLLLLSMSYYSSSSCLSIEREGLMSAITPARGLYTWYQIGDSWEQWGVSVFDPSWL